MLTFFIVKLLRAPTMMPTLVYAQKLLHSDFANLSCDAYKDKNEKYLGCQDGWVLTEKAVGRAFKFRQVWMQGFVVNYSEATDVLVLDDGTGASPFTVVHASRNPTTTKWLKAEGEAEKAKNFYVQVVGEPVVVKGADPKVLHIAAIKVQNLTEQQLNCDVKSVDISLRHRVAKAFEKSKITTEKDRLQLYEWILEVEDVKSISFEK